MNIHRKIGRIGMDVDPAGANEIYLEDAVAERIREPGLSGILSAIYEANNQPHLPLNLFLELTSHCNFNCPFCYVNEPGCQKASMPRFEELKKTLDLFIKKGLVHCTLSGGECLLHPDFSDIYTYLKLHGVLVTVFTNGYLLEEKHFRMLSGFKPFKLEISLYGHDDESYQATTATPKVKAERVFANVLRLKEDGVNVICKTPLTSLTEEESYPRIRQWCQAHDIPFYTGTELVFGYSGESRDGYLASQELRDRLKQEMDEAFFSDPERMALAVSEKAHQKKAFDCSGGRHDLFISSEFNLMPCMQAQWAGDDWKFNIKKMGVEAAYNSMESRIIGEKNKPIQGCYGCKYTRICQHCYFTQGQFNRTYCEDLKKYMRGGCNHG